MFCSHLPSNVPYLVFFSDFQNVWIRYWKRKEYLHFRTRFCRLRFVIRFFLNSEFHKFTPFILISIFQWSCLSKLNCSERGSFQIMRFWQMIGKWLGIAYRDWCGNKMGWIWCFLSSNLKFHKKYCQFHVQQPITSRMSSHSRAIWHHLKAVISKTLGVNILSKW